MDDEGVSATSERTALGQKAYLLFYQREGTDLGAGKGHQGGGVDVKALKAAKREAIERAGVKVAREREESLDDGAAADGDDKRARRVAPTRVNEVSEEDDDSSDESYRAGDGDGSSSDDPSSSSSSDSDSDSKASPTLKSSSLKSPTKYGKRGKLMSARERLAHKDLHALAAREKKHKKALAGLKKKKKGQDELSPVRTREGRKAAGLSPPRDEWQADELLRTAAKPSKEEKRAARRLKKEAKLALRETKKAAKKAALRETKKLALKKASRKHPENGDPDEEGDGLKPTAKDIRRWLNKEARVANVVGKGGRRSKLDDKQVVSAWDEDVERNENASPANGEKEKPPRRFQDKKRKKDVSAPGKKGFKRQRTYDDLDEDYDRGRLSKHQRRKAEGRAKSGPGPKGGLKGKTTTLFDSAQSLKKEIADMEKFGERLDKASSASKKGRR